MFGRERAVFVRMAIKAPARPRVLACERFARGEAGESEILQRAKGQRGLWGKTVTTLLEHGQYRLQQFDFPADIQSLGTAERREAMRWRIKDAVDFPIEDAGIDVFEMPAVGGRPAQLWVVAAPREVLQRRIRAFQDAKIPLTTIDIPELAQRNLASLFEQAQRGVALLSLSADGGLLTITHQDELYVARHIDIGLSLLADPANEMARERVLLDIQRTLDNFDRNYGAIPLASLCVGPTPGGDEFVGYLGENLSLPVERVDLSQVLDVAQTPVLLEKEVQAQAWFCLGAALREAQPEKR